MFLLLVGCFITDQPTDRPDDTDISTPDEVFCAPDEMIGEVVIQHYGGTSYLHARVYDKPDPWIGQPEASSEHCAYYVYSNQCGTCDAGTICSTEGECVEVRRSDPDASLIVTADDTEHNFEADETGLIWSQFTDETRFSFDLSWPGQHVVTEEFTLPDPLTDIWVTAEGNYDAPGALDVSWSASGADDHVRTVIPINHHAGAPTFTSCVASRDEEHFVVPAEMVDPLSVITGLEFQGLHYGQYAAINTDVGCVQATVFFHEFVDVQYTN